MTTEPVVVGALSGFERQHWIPAVRDEHVGTVGLADCASAALDCLATVDRGVQTGPVGWFVHEVAPELVHFAAKGAQHGEAAGTGAAAVGFVVLAAAHASGDLVDYVAAGGGQNPENYAPAGGLEEARVIENPGYCDFVDVGFERGVRPGGCTGSAELVHLAVYSAVEAVGALVGCVGVGVALGGLLPGVLVG